MGLKVTFLLTAAIASVFGFSGIVGGATETAGRLIAAVYAGLFIFVFLAQRIASLRQRKDMRSHTDDESAPLESETG
ncbi:DUF1328 domain-containing protein [Histidinibacterium aquaticum]|uniref:DUF1328 domain-containing protein n=1 Tax=Histidinibacterium aquaticum TaxID=2613962 RepID=A0A5J5GDN5_9RHOB|nr:DUF1328 domain-containing protein [Histidinibacterium aquaticum]KAA9005933.1 DUF1328 domain-containing protein [Histidinibacterium aquaticum]